MDGGFEGRLMAYSGIADHSSSCRRIREGGVGQGTIRHWTVSTVCKVRLQVVRLGRCLSSSADGTARLDAPVEILGESGDFAAPVP